jgi:hypothetical protein
MPARPAVVETEAAGVGDDAREDLFNRLMQSNPEATCCSRWDDLTIIDVNPALVGAARLPVRGTAWPDRRRAGLFRRAPEGETLLYALRSAFGEFDAQRLRWSSGPRPGAQRLASGFISSGWIWMGFGYLLGMFVDESNAIGRRTNNSQTGGVPELNPNPVLEFDATGRLTYFNRAGRLAGAIDRHRVGRADAAPTTCRVRGRVPGDAEAQAALRDAQRAAHILSGRSTRS